MSLCVKNLVRSPLRLSLGTKNLMIKVMNQNKVCSYSTSGTELNDINDVQFKRSNQWLKLSQLVNVDHKIPKLDVLLNVTCDASSNHNEKAQDEAKKYTFQKKRIGVLTSATESGGNISYLLQTLLLDPYNSDQEWCTIFNKRFTGGVSTANSDENIHILKYSPSFEMNINTNSDNDTIVTFGVPSKYLLENNLEFVEYRSDQFGKMAHKDQVLFYLNTDPTLLNNLHGYPHLNVFETDEQHASKTEDKKNVTTESKNKTINVDSAKMFTTLWNFYKDKKYVSEYLSRWDNCGLTVFESKFNYILEDYYGKVIRPTEHLVLNKIIEQDKDLNKVTTSVKAEKLETINKWYVNSHKYLQNEIMHIKPCTLREIYLYSESKLELNLLRKLDITKPILDNLNYIRGEMSIPSVTARVSDADNKNKTIGSSVNIIDTESIAKDLHTQINKQVYLNFIKLQLPMILICSGSVITGVYNFTTMLPIGLFAITLGVWKVLKSTKALWQDTLNKKVINPVRNFIEAENSTLIQECDLKNNDLKLTKAQKLNLIKSLYK